MTIRSALLTLREAGPWRVHSRLDGALLVKPMGRRKLAEKPGVLTRMYLASCLERVLEPTATAKRATRRNNP